MVFSRCASSFLLSTPEVLGAMVVALWPSEFAALLASASNLRHVSSSVAAFAWTPKDVRDVARCTLARAAELTADAIIQVSSRNGKVPWPTWRDALEVLRRCGFDATASSAALHAALQCGDAKILRRLLQASAEPEWPVEGDLTPLRWAARAGDASLVKVLVDHGANVNARGRYGYTALMTAALHGRSEVVELLLAAGADVNTNSDGETAIDLSHRFPDIVAMLESHVSLHGWRGCR